MAQGPGIPHEPPLGTLSQVDPREQQEWFQRLPQHAQDEFRDKWLEDAERMEEILERRRDTHRRYIWKRSLSSSWPGSSRHRRSRSLWRP